MPDAEFLSTPPSRVATQNCVLHRQWSLTFLSTPPSRVATQQQAGCILWACYFYPRHPRGWRHFFNVGSLVYNEISIHATLAGGDILVYDSKMMTQRFLSTPPSRVATLAKGVYYNHNKFLSTPPSRVATRKATGQDIDPEHFYPRHPRGWRPPSKQQQTTGAEFLSTPPSRVATPTSGILYSLLETFLSTPPSRVATAKVYKNVQCLLRKREKIICKIKNNLKHPPHIPIATSKKCTACPKMSDVIGAKLLEKVCLLPPRTGAATQAAHHPEQIRGGGQGAPRGFCSGCQAGKSAGCRFRGQSARPARL